MKRTNLLRILAIPFILFSCSGGKYNSYALDKKYWTPEDYDQVVRNLKFPDNRDDKLPTFDDPESRIIIEKLTDQENFKVILDDNELGTKYRNEIAEDFFDEWKGMNEIYWQMDRQDKYIYPLELVECFKFGLALQLRYFPLGNEAIKENVVDPNSNDVKNTINGNIKTLIGNYSLYLNIVKNEDAFSQTALEAYGDGIEIYFTELIQLYPESNFNGVKKKMELLIGKFKSESIVDPLRKIITLIEEKESNKVDLN